MKLLCCVGWQVSQLNDYQIEVDKGNFTSVAYMCEFGARMVKTGRN